MNTHDYLKSCDVYYNVHLNCAYFNCAVTRNMIVVIM